MTLTYLILGHVRELYYANIQFNQAYVTQRYPLGSRLGPEFFNLPPFYSRLAVLAIAVGFARLVLRGGETN